MESKDKYSYEETKKWFKKNGNCNANTTAFGWLEDIIAFIWIGWWAFIIILLLIK